MIVWSEKLYIGEQAGKNSEKLKKKLEAGKLVPDVYLIARPSNEENLFDILPAKELLFPYYKKREVYVYGMAKGMEEAEELLVFMLEDACRETDGHFCKEFFKEA